MKRFEAVYVVETNKNFKETLVAVRKAAETESWGVLGDYNFGEILNSKGFPQGENVKVLDICSPTYANALMSHERLTALCMPCSVLVYTNEGRTMIAALQPSKILPVVFETDSRALAAQAQIDEQIRTILDMAKD